MKKRLAILPLSLVLGLGVFLYVGGTATAQVATSKHDLSQAPYSLTLGNICIVCHAPHNASTTIADMPLSNREPGVAITTYSSPTLDATITWGGTDELCMSCHDGVTGTDAYAGAAGTAAKSIGTASPTSAANLGSSVANEHPTSFLWDATLAVLDPIYGATPPSPFKLFTNMMRCATCHDVHTPGSSGKFLRQDPIVCTSCHTNK